MMTGVVLAFDVFALQNLYICSAMTTILQVLEHDLAASEPMSTSMQNFPKNPH
jgi:hypothetical protein